MGDYVEKTTYKIRINEIEMFFSLEKIVELIGFGKGVILNERQKLVMKAIESALDKKEKGLSDDDD